MSKPFVAVLMGSKSDLPVIEKTLDVLKSLQVPFEVRITSAHRTPDVTHAYVKDADERGCSVFIAAAGLAAHLAGAVAGLTLKPVIGIPLDAGPLHSCGIRGCRQRRGKKCRLSGSADPVALGCGTC